MGGLNEGTSTPGGRSRLVSRSWRNTSRFRHRPVRVNSGCVGGQRVIHLRRGIGQVKLLTALVLLGAGYGLGSASAWANQLEDLSFSSAPGGRVSLTFEFRDQPESPTSFQLDNPARIAVDFAATETRLAERVTEINLGVVQNVQTVATQARTRAVINLTDSVPYEVGVVGRTVRVVVGAVGDSRVPPIDAAGDGVAREGRPVETRVEPVDDERITGVDFRRSPQGGGRVIVELSSVETPADIRRRGDRFQIDFLDAEVPERLRRRLDVTDFDTPVTQIDTFETSAGARVEVSVTGDFDELSYQTGARFVFEVNPIIEDEEERRQREYTGERLSLNFQDIEVRSVLQLIADFTGLNIVVSDSVSGNLTLRLIDVPWDQALDIILQTRGLGQRRNDNVILIAPNTELAELDQQELEAQRQAKQLEPLVDELIQINFARAEDIAGLLRETRDQQQTGQQGGRGGEGSDSGSVLSQRGSVTVDPRTNQLIVLDTAENIVQIRNLVRELDIPIRQVLIESRIVVANDDFNRELGVRLGGTGAFDDDDNLFVVSGSAEGSDAIVGDAVDNLGDTGEFFPVGLPDLTDRLLVNTPATAPVGSLGLAFLGSDYLIDLELSALQAEGRGEVISTPRVVTTSGQQAFISQGVEIPFSTVSQDGTNTEFRDAALSVDVTPFITPDDRVVMDLLVSQSTPGEIFPDGVSIDEREISTQVLVRNGDTVVLGGIYEQSRNFQTTKVPLLGDIPVVGNLFKNRVNQFDRAELLIFVTPKILKESLSLQDRF